MAEDNNDRTPRTENRNYRRDGNRSSYHGRSGGYGHRDDRRGGGYRGHSDRREYRPRERAEESSEEGEREYRPRREYNDRREGGYRGHSDRGNFRERREFKPRDDSSDNNSEDRKEYRPHRNYGGRREGGYRGHSDRREYRPRERTEGSSEEGEREYRPRRSYGDRREGGYRGRSDRGNYRERREYRPRSENESETSSETNEGEREYRPRREYNDRREGGYRGRSDRGRGERRSYDDRREYRPRRDEEDEEATESEECQQHYARPKPVLPTDPQKLLFRGVDFQANGNLEVAMVMYLHGAAKMSKGCENNALNILRDMNNEGIASIREKMSGQCSEDALVELDYLCYRADANADRSFLDSKFEEGNTHAVYCKIMLDELKGNEEQIDSFASAFDTDSDKVTEGLKYLKKRTDSEKAINYLESFDAKKELRQSVRTHFIRAKKGEKKSVEELKKLSKEFPEAAFFLEYIQAVEDGDAESWLISKYPQFSELIISVESNLQEIKDTPFGLFLRAKNIQNKKNDWIQPMIKAAKSGSDLALEELRPLLYRQDIKRVFATIYLKNDDVDKLLSLYRDGLDDETYLDQYCKDDMDKIFAIGAELGRKDTKPEIEWLVRNYKNNGYVECKQALIKKGEDSRYQTRVLIYALHDIGADMDAAMLYFKMDWSPELPSVKWLKKLCDDELVKEYIRSHYEQAGSLETFESIFIDDGYRKKSSFGKKSFGKKPYNKRRKY